MPVQRGSVRSYGWNNFFLARRSWTNWNVLQQFPLSTDKSTWWGLSPIKATGWISKRKRKCECGRKRNSGDGGKQCIRQKMRHAAQNNTVKNSKNKHAVILPTINFREEVLRTQSWPIIGLSHASIKKKKRKRSTYTGLRKPVLQTGEGFTWLGRLERAVGSAGRDFMLK